MLCAIHIIIHENLRQKMAANPGEHTRLLGGPGGFNWMPVPQETACLQDCPAGLEYLLQLDRFIVSRLLSSWGFNQVGRTYRVRNSLGQDIYFVKQNEECSCYQAVELAVTDSYDRQVANFVPGAGSSCLTGTVSDMNAEAPPGNIIGSVRRDNLFGFRPCFSVVNNYEETVLKITRSFGNFFSPKVDFKILSPDETQEVGMITKEWAGLLKSMFNFEAQHTFGITFPADLDVKMKMVMVLAAVIIDISFFERRN